MIVIALCMQNTEIHLRDKYLLIISHVLGQGGPPAARKPLVAKDGCEYGPTQNRKFT